MSVRNRNETVKNYVNAFWLLRKMLKDQWLSREQIETIQNVKLQKLVNYAYIKVPYYRRLFDKAGIKPEEIKTIRDLPKIPITSKADIKKLHPHEFISHDVDLNKCQIRTTSGSTGIPMTIFWDQYALMVFYSTSVRAHLFLKCTIHDKILCIGPTYYPDNLLFQRLGICRVKILSPFIGAEEHIKYINSYKPDVIIFYPSVLKGIHNFIKKSDINIYSPRLVITSGEFLEKKAHDDTAEILGSSPFQFYGSWEMGRIGNQCEYRNGLHLNEDIVIPEFIPTEANNGITQYRIVLTNLSNYVMPFIRYDQGDLVEPIFDRCPCGRSFMRIKMLDSRQSDVIQLPDGNTVSALRFTGMILDLPGVHQFKIIQETIDQLVIKIIKTEEYSDEATKKVLKEIDSLLPGVHTVLEIVQEIERDSSGKFRQFQSKL